MKTTIAMNILNKTLKLLVVGYDGVVCIYEVNTNDNGECKQIGQYLLFNMSQNSNNQQTTGINNRRSTVDESAQVYPPSLLRNESNTISFSSVLTNEKHLDDRSYNTAIEDHSLPPLSSPPKGDDE